MNDQSLTIEPAQVDLPPNNKEFSDVLSQVTSAHQSVIVRRDGKAIAAIVPLEYYELVKEALAQREVERLAAQIDWNRFKGSRPPQEWFDEDVNPFEAEEETAP